MWILATQFEDGYCNNVSIEERLNIESTSTCIRGDRQVIDTTG
jgi:hypothetical protein